MPTAVLWPYRFAELKDRWGPMYCDLAAGLRANDLVVYQHRDLHYPIPQTLPYTQRTDLPEVPADVVIYNHADISELRGNLLPTKQTWFFKPVGPDETHFTLDPLGYGPYSSIAYKEPAFRSAVGQADGFFRDTVQNWILSRTTKWGNVLHHNCGIREKDYILVIGQCDGDSTVSRYDFGRYITRLKAVVSELARVAKHPIVVKLHPYMDGTRAKTHEFSESVAADLRSIGKKVTVYTGTVSIHPFIEGARCVVLANSGAGIEAMMHHKPIISWGFPEYHWTTYDLRHLCDIERALKLDWFSQADSDAFLCWYYTRYTIHDEASAARRVRALMRDGSPLDSTNPCNAH